ncbi:MAG TPA: CsgG/HfaB family protein [Gemmatimonadales bacterium]|nr:CsgG/HfaB family protein [Gemmatimonadales bacterium]
MRTRFSAPALVLAGALLGACAGNPAPQSPAPANLPALEADQQQHPRDTGVLTRLGIAYYDAKQYPRARDVLNSALAIDGQNYTANVYLGLTYEKLAKYDSARVSYTAASAQARSARQRSEIEDRLTLLTRLELHQAAQDAIAQEATLSRAPPTPNAIAVFPFRYVGSNSDLQPLSRGLTEVMVTDLGKLPRLTLLERERVQALVDEMALTDSGRVDPGTGARSGRLLRAARVVQGSLQDVPGKTDLKLDATVVDATNASVVASGSGTDQLQQILDVEKQVLFHLLDQMGIAITPAERRALSERPTADLQAFLAYSRGLEDEDRGDYAAAAADYSAAVARDPNFRAAKERQATAQQAAQAQSVSPMVLAGISGGASLGGPAGGPPTTAAGPGRLGVLQSGVLYTVPSFGGTLAASTGGGDGPVSRQPATRPQLPEALGSDNAGQPAGLIGTIIIIITRP